MWPWDKPASWQSSDLEVGWSHDQSTNEMDQAERFELGWREGRVVELRRARKPEAIPTREPPGSRYPRGA